VSDAPPRAQTPISDLFATAVHRFGAVWADLLVASLVAVAIASLPVVAVHATGGSAGATAFIAFVFYAIGYFAFTAFVILRGLPDRVPRRRVAWAYATAVVVGALTGVLTRILLTIALVPLPLFLFAVPAVAAGDAPPISALGYSFLLAVRNFTRTWAVWLITIVFCVPVVISMFLAASAFTSGGRTVLAALALSVPVAWPFSALFVRALYGDLTGRVVVAPQDRSR
jgi:hypothetical protein